MFFKNRKYFLLASLFLQCGPLCRAADAQQNESNVTTTNDKRQEVIVKAKSAEENARKDTASKSVFGNSELNKYGDINIIDALKRLPGISVVDGKLSLPGMSAGYTSVLVDGEAPRGLRLENIAMSSIDRVEIYRLGSAEFSSQAISGTINIILKKIASSSQNQVKVELTNKIKPSTQITWLRSEKDGNLSYSIAAAAQDSHGSSSTPLFSTILTTDELGNKLQNTLQTVNNDAKQQSIRLSPRLQYKISSESSIAASATMNFVRGTSEGHTKYDFIVGPELPVSATGRTGRNEATLINGKVTGKTKIFDDVNLEINHSINSFSYDIDSDQAILGSSTGLNYALHTNNHMLDHGYTNASKIRIPSFKSHELVMGWDLSESNSTESRRERKQYQTQVNVMEDLQKIRSKVQDFALFLQDEWQFDLQSSAYLGLRWEAVKIESEGNFIEPLAHTSSVMSPIAQILWQLDSDNTKRLRLGLSRNYKAPDKNLLMTTRWNRINNTIYSPNDQGNPNLRPELAWSLSGAFEHDDSNDVSYAIRGTIRSIENLQREKLFFADTLWWKTYFNAGNAISQVLEFETQFPLKNVFPNIRDVNVSFNAVRNWTRNIDLKSDANVLSPTKLALNSNIDYRPSGKQWSAGTSIRYRLNTWKQESEIRQSYVQPPLEVDAYSLVNLDKKTVLRFACDNLIKKQEWNQDQIQYQSQVTKRTNFIPVYRTIRISLEHRF